MPGHVTKRGEDPCMSCSGGCSIPTLVENLPVAALHRVDYRPEEAGMGGWHCALACVGGPWGSQGVRQEGVERGCGGDRAQVGDLGIGRRFKYLSITTSSTLSCVVIMN